MSAESTFTGVLIDADDAEPIKIQSSPVSEGAVRITRKKGEPIDVWLCDLKTILKEYETWENNR